MAVSCLCFPHSLMHSESGSFSVTSFPPFSLHSQTTVLLRHVLNANISSLETLSFFLTLLAPAVTPLFVLSERWIHMPCGCFINCKQAPRRGPSGKQFTGKAEGDKFTLRVTNGLIHFLQSKKGDLSSTSPFNKAMGSTSCPTPPCLHPWKTLPVAPTSTVTSLTPGWMS